MYEKLSSQVIVAGMGEALGIKFEAIDFIFNLYEITDTHEKQDYFEKIQLIDSIKLNYKRKELIKKQQETKNKPSKRR